MPISLFIILYMFILIIAYIWILKTFWSIVDWSLVWAIRALLVLLALPFIAIVGGFLFLLGEVIK